MKFTQRITKFVSGFLDNWSPWRLRSRLKTQLAVSEDRLKRLDEAREAIAETKTRYGDDLSRTRNRIDELERIEAECFQLSTENYKLRKLCDLFEKMQVEFGKIAAEFHPSDEKPGDLTFDEAVEAMKAGETCFPVIPAGRSRDFYSFDSFTKRWMNDGFYTDLGVLEEFRGEKWKIVDTCDRCGRGPDTCDCVLFRRDNEPF